MARPDPTIENRERGGAGSPFLFRIWGIAHFLCYTVCVQGDLMGKNVTLRLDESIIRKAKHAAVERDQSLSEWVSGLITQGISKKARSLSAREKALKRLKHGFRLGGRPLSREEVHER
jgi:hypothetical protein